MDYDKILIDTNVCLDAIQRRKPYDVQALKILNLSEMKIIKGIVSAHTFDTIFYILFRENNIENVYQAIEGLRESVDVATVSRDVIDKALQLKWPDFEDAIHYHAALTSGCDAIVTRNKSGFREAELPVLSPVQFLESLDS